MARSRARQVPASPDAPPRRGRLRRVAAWSAKGVLRLAWGGVKAVGRLVWWGARAGWRAGRRYERGRRARRGSDEAPKP